MSELVTCISEFLIVILLVIRNLSKNAVAKPRKRTADSLDHTIEPKPSPKKLKRRATKRPARQLSPVLEVKRARSGRTRGLDSESDWLDFPFAAVKVEPESSSEEDMSVLYASGSRPFNDSLFPKDDGLCDVSLIEVAESLNLSTENCAAKGLTCLCCSSCPTRPVFPDYCGFSQGIRRCLHCRVRFYFRIYLAII